MKSLSLTLVDNQKSISENTSALKGVTMESIGKVKEMAANCSQVETNIRSIRDKSILFDNDIKQIKDQLVHLKRDKSKSRPTASDAEIQKLMKTKDEELKSLTDTVKEMKRKLHSTSLDVNNIKEDKRTKDSETEERQISLESELSDVRGWVEAMLNESNKQMRGIADEVENAKVKISKCSSDLSEVFVEQASSTGDVSLVKKALEDQIKEVKEFGNIQQRELLDKVLDLRGSFVDNQTEFVEKLKIANESLATLREEVNTKVDKLDTTISRKLEARTKNASESSDLSKKLEQLKTNVETSKTDMNKVVQDNKEKVRKLMNDVSSLESTSESLKLSVSSLNVKKLSDDLAQMERSISEREVENKKLVDEFKSEFSKLKNNGDSVESKLDSQKKNLTDMIRSCEKKSAENSSNIKTVENSLENKIKSVRESVESDLSVQSKNLSSADAESKILTLKKELDHVRNEVKIADLEGFKNVVNNTTETHNKLISSLQKSLDLIICEKTILESQTAVIDSKLTDVVSEREISEARMKDALKRLNERNDENYEKVNSFHTALRELNDKTENLRKMKTSLDQISSEVQSNKAEAESQLKESYEKLNNNYDAVETELKNLKNSVSNSSQSANDKMKTEMTEMKKSFKEQIDNNSQKIHESSDIMNNQSKVIDNLSDSLNQINRNYEFSDSQIQKVELKLTSSIDELSKLDLFVTEMQKKIERSLNEKSNKFNAGEVDNKIETAKQELENSLRSSANKIHHLEESVKDFYSKLENINDFNNFYSEVQALSSKVNQQKAKMIDLEANVTMQERVTSKMSDDLKKFNLGMTKLGKPDSGKVAGSDNISSGETAGKIKEELLELKSNFEKKADFADINKMKSLLLEETSKLENKLKETVANFSSIKSNIDAKGSHHFIFLCFLLRNLI